MKEVQTEANELRDSANKLVQRGSKSVFKDEDMTKVYSAVSDFVEDYNSVVEKGKETDSKAITRGASYLTRLAEDYEDELNAMGITIGKDDKLTINKDTFMKTDVNKVKDLFNNLINTIASWVQKGLSYVVDLIGTILGR